MQSTFSPNPPGQHRTRVHSHRPQPGPRVAGKSGRPSHNNPNAKKEYSKPVIVIRQKRKTLEESVANGYDSLPQNLHRVPRNGGYCSSRKGSLHGRNGGSYQENLIFYPTNYRKTRHSRLNDGSPSPKLAANHRTTQASLPLEAKTNGCTAGEQHSEIVQVVSPLSPTTVAVSFQDHVANERCSTSGDSERKEELCSNDSSTGSVTGSTTVDSATTESTISDNSDPTMDSTLHAVSSSNLGPTNSDKEQPCESHAEEEFLDALSNLSDDDKGENSSVPRINSESSVSSSAFATPGTCSGTTSQPATPPGDSDSGSLLVSVLEKKLLGLVSHHSTGINGLTGSNQDSNGCGDQQGDCLEQLKLLLVRASSDSGVEEPQFNDDDPHENESCTEASMSLSSDVASGTCTEGGTTFFFSDEHSQSKVSVSHERAGSDLSADINSSKTSGLSSSGLSDLLQQPFQLVSGASSPGDSFCSTSVSSPAPSSPSPPPPPSPSHSHAKPNHRQPVCVLTNTSDPSLSLGVDGDDSTQPMEKANPTPASLPVFVRCDSTPVFPSLPSPTSPTPTAAPVQHSLSKYPLHNVWVMWYFTSTRPQFANYASELQRLSSVCHVEEFWSVFNNILYPSELANNSDYHFFKKGIQPLWEDPANKHGGRWVLTVKNNTQRLDSIWMEILMALIGEHITKSHFISGVVVSRRKKGDRVALWTTDKRVNINLHICKQFLQVLALACNISPSDYPRFVQDLAEDRQGMSLVYTHHQDSLRSGSSYQSHTHVSLRNNIQYMLDTGQ